MYRLYCNVTTVSTSFGVFLSIERGSGCGASTFFLGISIEFVSHLKGAIARENALLQT